MSAAGVRVETERGIARVFIDRPERRNAMSFEMWGELAGACRALAADPNVRVVLLRGSGEKAFVSGADISEFDEVRADASRARSYEEHTGRAFSAIAELDVPVIALVHGYCVGGGVAIALECDLRYAADDAVFAIPAARLGLGYGISLIETALRVLGPSSAKELLFTAERFDAARAAELGLVSRVFPKAELDSAAEAIVARIAENAPLTVRAAKIALRELQKPAAHRDLAAAERAMVACYTSSDYAEGIRAFLEKRTPRFSGS
jgi:enoyl-CoA hydratase